MYCVVKTNLPFFERRVLLGVANPCLMQTFPQVKITSCRENSNYQVIVLVLNDIPCQMVIRYYRKTGRVYYNGSFHKRNFCHPKGDLRGEIFISDNSKCIRTSTGVGGLTSSRGRYGWFLE